MKYELKGNYFRGNFHQPPVSGPKAVDKIIERECPADLDTLLWRLPVDYRHVDKVAESAVDGFAFWKKVERKERIRLLKNYQEQLISKKQQMAEAIALESGKPLWEATGEAAAVIGKIDTTIEDSLPRIEEQKFVDIMPNTTGRIFFKPLGPSLVIGPFNFPCHLANTQILSSLIAGNSIIFKPSEKACYSAQVMVECFHQAGFPKGVINLIQGDGETAARLVKEKSIKGIYFTGSKEIGCEIVKTLSGDLSKLVALELGGKNPAIVHKDAEIDHTLVELLKGAFWTCGQRCTSTALVVIHKEIMEEVISRFHELAKKIVVDHPLEHEKEPFMGPLVDQKALDNYLLFMGMAKRENIKEIMRGKQLEKGKRGYYVSPSIHLAEDYNPKSHFLTNEIFGPNVTFIPYESIDQAINIANATEYGLAASVFSKSSDIYQRCIEELDVGLMNFNRATCGASAKLPFGGVKNSGNYRPAAVAAIDSCVYQMSGLDLESQGFAAPSSVKGLAL